MSFTFDELKKKTVTQLREIASTIEHDAVQGYSQLNKEHLLAALCKSMNIDMHIHHHVEGIDKTSIKKKLLSLKSDRNTHIKDRDHKKLKVIRRKIHRLKRKLHKASI